MKKFKWKEFMRTHPLFSSLDETEIEEFLKEGMSEEKEFAQGTLIVREGEFSDTIFLIGSGSVQVVLPEKGGNEISLSILRRGEIFGEMAVLDTRQRSATVKANENCTLLEVKGQEFLKILGDHPDIEFKILLKLSERLRILNDHLLTTKVQDIDETLKLFNSKLDAELKAVEASLKAAQAVFDQTKVRADEVISSAERSRTRVNITFSTITAIVGAVVGLLGWLGFSSLQQFNDSLDKINTAHTEAKQNLEEIKKAKVSADESKQVHQSLLDIGHRLADNMLMPSFKDALARDDQLLARDLYLDIQKLKADSRVTVNVLNRIQESILEKSDRNFTDLLGTILEEATDPEHKIFCGYLLLTNAILIKKIDPGTRLPAGETATFESLQKDVETHKLKRTTRDEFALSLSRLQKLFEKQDKLKQEAFDRVKKLTLGP